MLNSWDHNFTLLPAICLWKSSCIKNNERKTQNWKLLRRFDNPTHNNFTGWYYTNCHEMIQCFGIKKCIYIYIYIRTHVIFKPHSIEIFHEILLVMIHTRAGFVYWTTSQWCENIQTSSYWCPIFFPPFGSCQRSTSNSMRWNQALLLVSDWCITRPGRSRLCKHTLSKPIEDVGCWTLQ